MINTQKLYFIEAYEHCTKSNLKQRPKEQKLKTVEYLPLTTIPANDRWKLLIPALICHVNESKKRYITSIHGCVRIKVQHPIR